jgi:hypothetical protein
MKLNPMLTSTPQLTSNGERYLHFPTGLILKRPKPPTPEAVARAQFVDKTYVWKGAAPKAQLP